MYTSARIIYITFFMRVVCIIEHLPQSVDPHLEEYSKLKPLISTRIHHEIALEFGSGQIWGVPKYKLGVWPLASMLFNIEVY